MTTPTPKRLSKALDRVNETMRANERELQRKADPKPKPADGEDSARFLGRVREAKETRDAERPE